MIDLYFLISAEAVQVFFPSAKHVVPIGIPTKEAKSQIETLPATVEAKISRC